MATRLGSAYAPPGGAPGKKITISSLVCARVAHPSDNFRHISDSWACVGRRVGGLSTQSDQMELDLASGLIRGRSRSPSGGDDRHHGGCVSVAAPAQAHRSASSSPGDTLAPQTRKAPHPRNIRKMRGRRRRVQVYYIDFALACSTSLARWDGLYCVTNILPLLPLVVENISHTKWLLNVLYWYKLTVTRPPRRRGFPEGVG